MSRAPTSLQLLGFGLALVALGACATQATSPDSEGDVNGSGNGNNGGSAGQGVGGGNTAGSNNPVKPNTGGAAPGTGGTPSGTAGAAPGTAGAAGSPAGTAGSAPAGGCPTPPAVGTAATPAELLIDDLEDADNGLKRVGGRTGFWYTYLDALGSTITPAPDKTGTMPLRPVTTDCHGGTGACVAVSGATGPVAGTNYPFAGVGFDFSNASKSCPYNGSAYTGIRFWARGAATVRIKVVTAAVADAASGGVCAAMCNDAFGMAAELTAAWSQVDVPLAVPSLAQEGWGTPATFDKTTLLALQIQVTSGQTFALAFDDFTFY